MHDGLVVVDKPAGCTSHDVVAKLRKVYGQRRVGHAGTLDPDATGVLLVGLGRATRLLRFLRRRASRTAGASCSASRPTRSTRRAKCSSSSRCRSTRDEVERRAAAVRGRHRAVPPMVSAVKIGGRRLHELARAGDDVERAPRPVHVDRFVVEDFEPGAYPEATIAGRVRERHVRAHAGRRPRRRARRVRAPRRRCGACASARSRSTRRTRSTRSRPSPTPRCCARRRRCAISNASTSTTSRRAAVAHGIVVRAPARSASDGAGPFALVGARGDLLAVYERRGAGVKPAVVLGRGRAVTV